MQAHSSRHYASEALSDRHPYKQPPFEKEPRKDEIAEAYGDRQIPKLVGVLQLTEDQLPESERVHCLKLFSQLLSTQETKVRAIQAEALQSLLTWLSHPNSSAAVRQLCCNSISSICQLQQGRALLAASGGVLVLTDALVSSPEAAVQAVKAFATTADGASALHDSPAPVTAALVKLIDHPGSSYTAARDAATCISGLCKSDDGVIEALSCEAPRSLGQLCTRALRHSSAIASGNTGHGLICLSGMTVDELLPLCVYLLLQAPQQASCFELLGVLDAAAEALLVISHHQDGKTQLRQADCIPVLAELLAVSDDSVAGSAAACLASLSIEVDSKVPVMTYAGEKLIQRAREGKMEVSPSSRTALLSAAEHLDARRKLELLLPGAELHELLGVLPQVPHDYKCVVWTNEPAEDR